MWSRFAKIKALVLSVLCLSGCAMQWEPHWQEAGNGGSTRESAELLKRAEFLYEQAEDKESLIISIDAYKKVLAVNPGEYEALAALSTQYILLGTAYTEGTGEKSEHFRRAMKYAELAMYTNADFKNMVDAGRTPWEAAGVLGRKEVKAMFFWVTALQYEFKEGMNLAEKIVNVGWLRDGLIFLDRIEQVDPEFGGGAVEFGKVICYYALPESKGGSKVKGDKYMALSVEKGSGWLLPRWARGKYYYAIKGDDENARKDLMWVAGQSLNEFKDPYPWKVHFQEDAIKLVH